MSIQTRVKVMVSVEVSVNMDGADTLPLQQVKREASQKALGALRVALSQGSDASCFNRLEVIATEVTLRDVP